MIITPHVERAVEDGAIEPLDTEIAAQVWFGSLNEILPQWILSGRPKHVEDTDIILRVFFLRSVGGQQPVSQPERKR